MIKCEVIENFTLKDFDKIEKSLIRGTVKNEKGHLYLKDTFECDEEMAKYLTGENAKKKVVVKVLEVIPKKVKEDTKVICEDEEVEKLFEEKPKTIFGFVGSFGI